jgi:hypothetical protein
LISKSRSENMTNIWEVGNSVDLCSMSLVRSSGASSLTQSLDSVGGMCDLSKGNFYVKFRVRIDPKNR